MRIGIDVDGTLTDIKDKLESAALKYAKSLNKKVLSGKFEDDNRGDMYKDKYNFSDEELKHFFGPIQEEITNNAMPRENVVKIIKKLKERGHEIYIITARNSKFHDNPYSQTKEWLDKNGIVYDQIIVNARDKGIVCVKEKINLFIDDQLGNCISVQNKGIKTIRFSNDSDNFDSIKNIYDWNDIYNYIEN